MRYFMKPSRKRSSYDFITLMYPREWRSISTQHGAMRDYKLRLLFIKVALYGRYYF